ncbi:hypothetical protein ACFSYH_05860 [Populibacterium corticicola]|uniref:Uncharacterized protein n=1 Tax=Populibacterium corticicola TaxID=1812826 RepID=A0ABW5XDX7_9MICO
MAKTITFVDGQILTAADLNTTTPEVPNTGDPVDTGWVTNGLDIVAAEGWEIVAYALRRTSMSVTGQVILNRTGATITPNAAGNFTDSLMFTLPLGWRNANILTPPIMAFQSGVKSAFGRMNPNSGNAVLTHGIPGVTVDNAAAWYVPLNHLAG